MQLRRVALAFVTLASCAAPHATEEDLADDVVEAIDVDHDVGDGEGDDPTTIRDRMDFSELPGKGEDLFIDHDSVETVVPSGERILVAQKVVGDRALVVVVRAVDGAPARMDVLPMAATPYATFPRKVVERAGELWVFASTVSGKDFGDDFPGCPMIVRRSQDGGYVARYDGDRWEEVPYVGGALWDARVTADDAIEVESGDAEAPSWTMVDPAPCAR